MTATATRRRTVFEKNADTDRIIAFARSLLPRFSIIAIDRNDPIVLILLNRYRRLHNLEPGPVVGEHWKAMTFDGRIVMVYAEWWSGKTVITDNVCPAASRWGKLAVYALLLFYRLAYESGEIRGFIVTVLANNEPMQRAIARVFWGLGPATPEGLPEPHSVVYKLGG